MLGKKISVTCLTFLMTLGSIAAVSAVTKNSPKNGHKDNQAIELAKLKSIDEPYVAPVDKSKVASSLNPAEQEFISKITKMNTLTADFVQTEQDAKQSNNQLKGKLALIKPNKLRWEILSPEKERQVYITNGLKFWHYDKALEQVVIDNFDSKRITSSPLYFLLMNTESVTKIYTVTKLSDGLFELKTKPSKPLSKQKKTNEVETSAPEIETEVILEPKYKTTQNIKSAAEEAAGEINPDLNDNYTTDLKLSFDLKTDKLTKISFTAAKSKTIVIDLSNVIVNSAVKAPAFDFKPPKGVDVINASELYE